MDWFTEIDDLEIEVIEFSVSTPMQIDTRELQFDLLKRQFLSQLPRRIEELDADASVRGRRLLLAHLAREAKSFDLFDLWRLALNMLDQLRSSEPTALRHAMRNLKAEVRRLQG